jgi:hypothetical protein
MKKHRINNIMILHKNLSYAMREANLTLRVFCVCSACVVQSVSLVRDLGRMANLKLVDKRGKSLSS